MAKVEATIHVQGLPEVRELMRRADEQIGQLTAIVRAIAECEPMAHCPGDDMYGDWYECGFCGVQADSVRGRYGEWEPVDHSESCEWRRARAWVDAEG